MTWKESHSDVVREDFEHAKSLYSFIVRLKFKRQPSGACYQAFSDIASGEYIKPYDCGEWSPRETIVAIVGCAIEEATRNQKVRFALRSGPSQRRLKKFKSEVEKAHQLMNEHVSKYGNGSNGGSVARYSDALFASSVLLRTVEETLGIEVLKYEDPFFDRFKKYSGDILTILYESLKFGEKG